ncbi:MAG: hypothetical protein AAFO69_06525 [Bacteroidota bacterium]
MKEEEPLAFFDEVVKKVFGSAAHVQGYKELSKKNTALGRLTLRDAEIPTVIIKYNPHLGRMPAAAGMIDLLEEQLVFQHLATLSIRKKLRPTVLGMEHGRFILIEDLGEKTIVQKSDDYDSLLAASFAHLHGSSMGRYSGYQALRNKMGLGHDFRRYGKPAMERLFARGRGFLANRFDISYLRHHQPEVVTILDKIENAIKHPGRFHALIHDHLSNQRQFFVDDDDLLLLDFELARYSHSLLDFVKPVMGQFAINEQDSHYQWIGPYFSLQLLHTYRDTLANEYGQHYEDDEWREAIFYGLSYGAISFIGRLCYLEPDRKLVGSLSSNIKMILHRMQELCLELKVENSLTAFIGSFLKEG